MLSPMNRLPSAIRTVMYAALPIMRNIGLLRFFSGSSQRRPPRPGITREQEEYFQFLDSRPNSIVTDAKEAWNWEKSASEARMAGSLGDRPLVVLTAGRAFVPRNPLDAREAEDFHQKWVSNLQPQLARLSSRGRQVIVEKSGHAIAREAPEAVLTAIREVVMDARAQRGNHGR
jgi:pimeloyl-ACP methyl ester carboxylesterase